LSTEKPNINEEMAATSKKRTTQLPFIHFHQPPGLQELGSLI